MAAAGYSNYIVLDDGWMTRGIVMEI